MSFLTKLSLSNFRCYDGAALTDLSAGAIALYGPNGAGKTNILEAVSLLSPGRGLRGAKTIEIQKQGAQDPWAVAATIDGVFGVTRIGTGADAALEKRLVRINGEAAKGQAAMAEYLSCVWLTPQMDRIFLDSAGTRRRFLDRLVYAFDAAHAGRITRYDNAMAQRAKLLKESQGMADAAWLDALESNMAGTGIAIAAARLDFMQRLQSACDRAGDDALFPRARLRVSGTVEDILTRAPALEAEALFSYQLKSSRARDMVTGGAATGPHKSDLIAHYAAKDMAADQCSTGEQKALLIGIILAHARLIKAERGAPPILLLDEVAAHLDENRRCGLYDLLQEMKGQVWLTGTDAGLFDALRGRAAFYHIEGATINCRQTDAPDTQQVA